MNIVKSVIAKYTDFHAKAFLRNFSKNCIKITQIAIH